MPKLRAALCALAVAALPFAGLHAQEGGIADGDPNEVVARVDGMDITRDDVSAAILSLPAEYQQLPVEALWEPMLNQIIDRKLVVEAAREQGLEESDDYKDNMALLGEQVLQQIYLSAAVEERITDEMLQESYDAWAEEYLAAGSNQEVHARHILVETQDEAQAALERIEAGEDFAAVAQELSLDPGSVEGGDLGWFRREDMVEPFAEAAFALEPGQLSDPVETQFGWHIIRLEERRETPVPTFEEMAPNLESTLAESAVYDELAALRENAEVEILVTPVPAAE